MRRSSLGLALALVLVAGTLPAAAGLARAFLADEVVLKSGKTERGSVAETPGTVAVTIDPRTMTFPRADVREVREDAAGLPDGTVVHGKVEESGGTIRVAAERIEVPRTLVESVRRRAHLTDQHLRRALGDPFSWKVIGWTAGIALLGTLGAVLLGVPYALLTARTALPGRRFFGSIYAAPLVLPPLLTAMAWDNLLPLGWIEGSGSLGRTGTALQAAALFALSYFPFVTLFARRSLASVGASAEEAAVLSAGRWPALRRVTLPLARPGILLGALFAFVFCLNDFSVVDFLNLVRTADRQVMVYPFLLQLNFNRHLGGVEELLAAGLPLASLSLAAAVAAVGMASRGSVATVGSAWRCPRPIPLGIAGRALGVLFCAGVLAVAVLVPALELAAESKGRATFERIFIDGNAAGNLRLTLGLAVAATLLAVPAAVVLAEAGRRFGRSTEALLAGVALLPLALVPSLVPLGAMEIWDRPAFTFDRGGAPWNPVYDTHVLAGLVLFARVFPFALAATWASLRELEPSLFEAGEAAGIPWRSRMARVVLPLVRPGAALGGLLAFVFAVRELDALAVLKDQTLLKRLWNALHFQRDETVAAMAIVLLALIAFAFGLAAATGWLRPRAVQADAAPASRSSASS